MKYGSKHSRTMEFYLYAMSTHLVVFWKRTGSCKLGLLAALLLQRLKVASLTGLVLLTERVA